MEIRQGGSQVLDILEHCGNAPRNIVIRGFRIALYQRDIETVTADLHLDIQREIVGSDLLTGDDEVCDWIGVQSSAVQLQPTTVITYGTDCGADGWVVHVDGSITRFTYILVFAGHRKTAKIKQVRSYLICRDAEPDSF